VSREPGSPPFAWIVPEFVSVGAHPAAIDVRTPLVASTIFRVLSILNVGDLMMDSVMPVGIDDAVHYRAFSR